MTSTCLIAVGSNLGDRLENVRAGVAGVAALGDTHVVAVSRLYETAPVGGPEHQAAYYNAAMLVTTTAEPGDLLAALHRIEAGRERERSVRWGPRTLDLDLLVYGDLVSDDPALLVPHPRQHERRFVLVPVCDVGAEIVHPTFGRSMRELLADLPVEPGDLTAIAADWHHAPERTTT